LEKYGGLRVLSLANADHTLGTLGKLSLPLTDEAASGIVSPLYRGNPSSSTMYARVERGEYTGQPSYTRIRADANATPSPAVGRVAQLPNTDEVASGIVSPLYRGNPTSSTMYATGQDYEKGFLFGDTLHVWTGVF